MSGPGDYDTEMFRRHPIDDAAIEAAFTGNGAGDELAWLAAFAEDVRAEASGPAPVPSVQLAAMLAQGFSIDNGDLSATAASNVPGPAPQAAGLPKWRRRKMVVAELIAGLGWAAKAAFGIGVAAASVTAAGAAGVLPGPAQGAVASAVEAVTPFSFPDEADDDADFGERVSTDARDGGVDGEEISEEAKENGEANRPAEPGQTGLDRADQTPAAGHAPTSVPSGKPAAVPSGAPAGAGSQSSTGIATANSTPAAGHTPEAVPGSPATAEQYRPEGAGSQSSTGTGTASGTPAGSYLPDPVPPAPPTGRP